MVESERLATWKEASGCSAQVVEWVSTAGRKVFLIKPQSFMNRSGEPLRALMGFYKIEPHELLVVHDEVDLDFGRLHLKFAGGAAGNNGIRSIIESLGTPEFTRLRFGIGRPDTNTIDQPAMSVADWVLARFDAEQQKELGPFVDRALHAIRVVIEHGVKCAQNQFNAAG